MTKPVDSDPSAVHAPHGTLSEYYKEEKDRPRFVRRVFDETAEDYDRIERMMALGSGPRYRRRALARAGLAPDMDVLDVAVGTGLVAREAAALVGDARRVIGVDASIGMLRSAARPRDIVVVQGMAESLPCFANRFDFLTLGFALRHLSDLSLAFAEFHRVLRPGGTVCLLEITMPKGPTLRRVLKTYMRS